MLYQLETYPSVVLTSKSSDVLNFDKSLEYLAEQLIEWTIKTGGVGMAAVQLGSLSNVFVFSHTFSPENPQPLGEKDFSVAVNPELSIIDKELETATEGCLSIPDVRVNVPRPRGVKLKAYDLKGKLYEEDFIGMPARIIQHEADHLRGKLILSYANKDNPIMREIKSDK